MPEAAAPAAEEAQTVTAVAAGPEKARGRAKKARRALRPRGRLAAGAGGGRHREGKEARCPAGADAYHRYAPRRTVIATGPAVRPAWTDTGAVWRASRRSASATESCRDAQFPLWIVRASKE